MTVNFKKPEKSIGEIGQNYEPRTWSEFLDNPNYFEDCYTIDPYNVESAWEKLGHSTLYLQLANFPAIIFFGFKDTFEKIFEKSGV